MALDFALGRALLRGEPIRSPKLEALPHEVWEVSVADPRWELARSKTIKNKPKTVNAGFWYFLGDEDSVRHERMGLLLERCRALQPLACVIQLPPERRVAHRQAAKIAHEIKKRWNAETDLPLFFEPGRLGPPHWLDPREAVFDPLWSDPNSRSSPYWKIHGWHLERWIRLYSDEALQKLANQIVGQMPRFVILVHSQRVQQLKALRHKLQVSSRDGPDESRLLIDRVGAVRRE